MPYYFYMCDMIPFSEHWRVSVADAQRLQHDMMGYLPGFATPRIVCDVPFVGKRWVHQLADYDQEHGISYWTKNYRTSIEASDPEALTRTYAYYDPIHTLPESARTGGAGTPSTPTSPTPSVRPPSRAPRPTSRQSPRSTSPCPDALPGVVTRAWWWVHPGLDGHAVYVDALDPPQHPGEATTRPGSTHHNTRVNPPQRRVNGAAR